MFGRFAQAEVGRSHSQGFIDDVCFVLRLEDKAVRIDCSGLREEIDGFTQKNRRRPIKSGKRAMLAVACKQPIRLNRGAAQVARVRTFREKGAV